MTIAKNFVCEEPDCKNCGKGYNFECNGAKHKMVTLLMVQVQQLVCLRCGFKWFPNVKPDGTISMPQRCASKRCRTPYWNKKREKK